MTEGVARQVIAGNERVRDTAALGLPNAAGRSFPLPRAPYLAMVGLFSLAGAFMAFGPAAPGMIIGTAITAVFVATVFTA